MTSLDRIVVMLAMLACACVPAVLLPKSMEPTGRTFHSIMKTNSCMLLLMGWLPLMLIIGLGTFDYMAAQPPEALAPDVALSDIPPPCQDANITRKYISPDRVRIWRAAWGGGTNKSQPDKFLTDWGVSPAERCGEWLHRPWGAPAQGGYQTACQSEFAQSNCSRTCHLAMQCKSSDPHTFPCGRWYIRGKAYDLNSFIKRHPGGPRYLLDSVNTDVTALFESYHIGTTAQRTLAAYLDEAFPGTQFDEEIHQWPTNLRFNQLKLDIAKQFNLNDLKEPSAEYRAILCSTLASHVALTLVSLTSGHAGVAWLAHAGLAFTTATSLGLAHNGIHLYLRRPVDSMLFYLMYPTTPFRWLFWHVQQHHVHSNTRHDPDKQIFGEYQQWWQARSPLALAAPLLGTTAVAFEQATHVDLNHTSPSISLVEQRLGLLLLTVLLAFGLRAQGWRYALRLLFTLSLVNAAGFIAFQASHFQKDSLDGDLARLNADDWGEFQIRTTVSWGQFNRPAFGTLFGFLNYHTAHHMFPGVHHSKLPLIAPLIRKHYPELFQDYPIGTVLRGLYAVMSGRVGQLCRSNHEEA